MIIMSLSKNTQEESYDTSNLRRGVALIFNHAEYTKGHAQRFGTLKDGEDLVKILTGLDFDVRLERDNLFYKIYTF